MSCRLRSTAPIAQQAVSAARSDRARRPIRVQSASGRRPFGSCASQARASICALTGAVGALTSFGWFCAFTLQQAAIVKALAQIEMIFTLASTVFIFREPINRLELTGCGLIVSGIVVLMLVG